MSLPALGPTLVVSCLGMAIAAGAIGRWLLSAPLLAPPVAAMRAALQLAAVALILAAALRHLWSSVLLLMVMFTVAAATAARRSHAQRGRVWVAASVACGVLPVAAVLLASGVVPPTGVAIVPTVGIVMGGAMTSTATAARRALGALAVRHAEVEAALSLGAPDRVARFAVIAPELRDALVPTLDQTSTAGLVTLPGAFVGVLLATGSPAAAGAAQVLILIALLLAQALGVAAVGQLLARGVIRGEGVP